MSILVDIWQSVGIVACAVVCIFNTYALRSLRNIRTATSISIKRQFEIFCLPSMGER